MILKIEEFSSPFPTLTLKVDRMEWERMRSSGLQCEVCVVHIKWIKGETGGLGVSLLKFVSDLMDVID